MRTSKKALSLFIALILAAIAAFGLMAACSKGDGDGKTAAGDEGSGDTYVFGTSDGIELDKETLSIGVGEKSSLKATVITDNGNRTSDFVVWTSSDDDVAEVSSGIVTGKKSGKATITASISGTDYSASCLVTVTNGKTLTVGVKDDVKNFGYYDYVTRTYSGMEIDLAYMIAGELCYEDVELVTVDPSKRVEKLENRDVDMVIATFSITEERQELVNFSTPYYEDSVQILLGEEYSKQTSLKNVSDFPDYLENSKKTMTMGTVEETTAFSAFDEYCSDEDISWTSPLLGDYFVNETYADYEACWEALTAGVVDAFIADHSILQSYTEGSTKYRFLDSEFSEQQYGVATALDSELSVLVDEVVENFLEDGTMNALLASYGLA